MVAQESHQHAAPQGFIRKYIFSLDHKVIGLQYYFLALTAVFVGMALSLLMRIHLIWPTATLPLLGEIKPETYLALVTMHGTIMVFFVLTTAPQGGFASIFGPPRRERCPSHSRPARILAFILTSRRGERSLSPGTAKENFGIGEGTGRVSSATEQQPTAISQSHRGISKML